jgi:hypothetical protein
MSLTYLLTYLLTHSLTYLLTHSLTHSLIIGTKLENECRIWMQNNLDYITIQSMTGL